MTKRRPSWSDRWRRTAALACGLLLLSASSAVWAASKKPSGKPAAHKKALKPSPRKKGVPGGSAGTVEPADMIFADAPGLHGQASFYGTGFQGHKTSTGEVFDAESFTAASNAFPLGMYVAVRRLDNDRCAIVKVNDRMHARHRRRIIDVSRSVAEYLDMLRAGVVLVRVAALKRGKEAEAGACRAAFEPADSCPSCDSHLHLPDFAADGG